MNTAAEVMVRLNAGVFRESLRGMGAPTEAGSAMKKYTNTLQCVPNLLSE